MYLLDTNILLEVMLSQRRKDEVKKLLTSIMRGELTAYISKFSLYSIEILLAKLGKFDELRKFLIAINKFQGLRVLSTTLLDDILIVNITRSTKLDFDDALQYYLVKKYNLRGIISFDKDFDNLDIKRYEPKDIVP
ncbi:MAG: PIN domain-containing protein [Candidatus Asgardarchaeum sp.]|nr:type II toxin-antitoxin system VapC family toxin [Candidatus Odinarchaeota archaeon]